MFKKKEKKFSCLGVKVQYSITDEDLQSCIEFYSKGLKSKYFTSENLDLISNKLGFDIKEYYFFVDNEDLENKAFEMSVKILYRFKGSKSISEPEIEEIIKHIDSSKFYDRSEIENLSQKLGFSVYDRCIFHSHTVMIYTYKIDRKEIMFLEN